jgi:hypothetical protein
MAAIQTAEALSFWSHRRRRRLCCRPVDTGREELELLESIPEQQQSTSIIALLSKTSLQQSKVVWSSRKKWVDLVKC